MIKNSVNLLVQGKDLSEEEMIGSMRDIMEGQASDALIASFLTALRIKGETVDEITGAVKVMREKAGSYQQCCQRGYCVKINHQESDNARKAPYLRQRLDCIPDYR